MLIYRITIDEGAEPYFESTLATAHDHAKIERAWVDTLRIELLDVKTDKESIVEMLNYGKESGAYIKEGPLRTWRLTPLGGIKEIDNGT